MLKTITLDKTKKDQLLYEKGTTRDYDGKDTLGSLKNFYIDVRDSGGNQIDFAQVGGYEVEIAIWISPEDPKLFAF